MQMIHGALWSILTIVTLSWSNAEAQTSNADFSAYISKQESLERITDKQADLARDASMLVAAAQRMGLGGCSSNGTSTVETFFLQYLRRDSQACGPGKFSSYCIAALNNCVATETAITCDYDYLVPFIFLQGVATQGEGAPPAFGMHMIARLVEVARRQRPDRYELDEEEKRILALLSKDPTWRPRSAEEYEVRGWAIMPMVGGVMWHELSHTEQKTCAVTHDDPRSEAVRDRLHLLSCRTLSKAEFRADARALDVIATVADVALPKEADQRTRRKKMFLRGLIAMLEYEAMILASPQYAAEIYQKEPSNPAERERYYQVAGQNYPDYGGSGHIPPELRPSAAFLLLADRGFFLDIEPEFLRSETERLRPFLTGLLWKRCHGAQSLDKVRRGIEDSLSGAPTVMK